MQLDRDGTVVDGEESSSDSDEDMGGDPSDGHQGMQKVQHAEPRGPIIDDDGFQLVQTRKPGRTR
jgi:hypothetical protein